jgi:hypothetical protein
MSLDRWRQFEVLSEGARNLEPSQQRAFLAAACDRDEDLLREVERSFSLSDAASTVAPLNSFDWLPNTSFTASSPAGSLPARVGRYRDVETLGGGGRNRSNSSFFVRRTQLIEETPAPCSHLVRYFG